MTPFRGVDHRAPDLLQISYALSTWDIETRSTSDRISQVRGRILVAERSGAEGVRTPDPHTASPIWTVASTWDSVLVPGQTGCNHYRSVQYGAVRCPSNPYPCSRLLQHVPV
jgi:hypothetical protein